MSIKDFLPGSDARRIRKMREEYESSEEYKEALRLLTHEEQRIFFEEKDEWFEKVDDWLRDDSSLFAPISPSVVGVWLARLIADGKNQKTSRS